MPADAVEPVEAERSTTETSLNGVAARVRDVRPLDPPPASVETHPVGYLRDPQPPDDLFGEEVTTEEDPLGLAGRAPIWGELHRMFHSNGRAS